MANFLDRLRSDLQDAIAKDDKKRSELSSQVSKESNTQQPTTSNVNAIPPVSNARVTDSTNALPKQQSVEPARIEIQNTTTDSIETPVKEAASLDPLVEKVAGVFPVSPGAATQTTFAYPDPALLNNADQNQGEENSNALDIPTNWSDRIFNRDSAWNKSVQESKQDFDFSSPAAFLFGENGVFSPKKGSLVSGSEEDQKRSDNAPNRFTPLSISDSSLINQYDSLAHRTLRDNTDPLQSFVNSRIDDMSFGDMNSRSSDMTGEKYIWYQEQMGLGGRPISEIDPNGIYNKNEEFKYYGFNPIIRDQDMLNSVLLDSVVTAPNRLVNEFADLREDNRGDWFINNARSVDGNVYNDINGDSFFSGITDYFNRVVNNERNSKQPGRVLTGDQITSAIRNNPNYAKYKENGIRIINADGSNMDYPGADPKNLEFEEADINQILATGNYDSLPFTAYLRNYDGSPYLDEDGDQIAITFDSYNEYYQTISPLLEETFDPNDDIVQAVRIDPMMLDDQQLPYQVAYDIIQDNTGDKDYGLFNINKPADQVNPFIDYDDENGFKFNMQDVVPSMIDIALNSAPYMMPLQVMAPITASNMYQASKGLDARSLDNLSYRQMAEDLDNERYLSNIFGELLIPVSEKLFGVGGRILGNNAMAQPLRNIARETLGEGVEEVIQNPIEEVQRYGFTNAYANPLEDDNGNTLYDSTGHELRDPATVSSDRFFNAITGMPNDFLAGAMMGAGFNAPNIPSAWRQHRQNTLARNEGVTSPYVSAVADPFTRYNQQYAPLDMNVLEQEARERGYIQ